MAKKRRIMVERRRRKSSPVMDDEPSPEEGDSRFSPIHLPSDDLWFAAGIDIDNRIIELTGDVSEQMSSLILRALVRMNLISHDPITIYLSSCGGNVYDGFAIYDLIRASPSPVVIYANGKIISMGIVVLLAGDKRYAAKNTRFMIHSVSHGTIGKVRDTRGDVKEAEIANINMMKIIAERTKLNYKELKSSIEDKSLDVWFGLTTAKKYGILTVEKVRKKKR